MDDLGVIISWLIIGAMSGSLIGRLFKGRKEGYGFIMNLILGCAGALLGWLVFKLFDISLGIDISITFDQVVAAMAGTAVVILIWKIVGKSKKKAA